MSIILLLVFGSIAFVQSTVLRECDNMGILVYDDMKCKPNFDGQHKCPLSYDCPDIKKSDDACHFKGESIKDGEHLNASAFCNIGCICHRRDGSMQFSCAELDCREYGPSPPEACYFKYSLDKCCGRLYCPSPDLPVHKCTYEGREYKEGERFYPKHSCSMCLCQKGFKGKIEDPFCVPYQCDGQIRYQEQIQKACAPIYNRQEDTTNGILCCPNLYTCPYGNETIEGHSTSALECKYGNTKLKLGQGFKKEVKEYSRIHKVSCKCKVPPLLTCVIDN